MSAHAAFLALEALDAAAYRVTQSDFDEMASENAELFFCRDDQEDDDQEEEDDGISDNNDNRISDYKLTTTAAAAAAAAKQQQQRLRQQRQRQRRREAAIVDETVRQLSMMTTTVASTTTTTSTGGGFASCAGGAGTSSSLQHQQQQQQQELLLFQSLFAASLPLYVSCTYPPPPPPPPAAATAPPAARKDDGDDDRRRRASFADAVRRIGNRHRYRHRRQQPQRQRVDEGGDGDGDGDGETNGDGDGEEDDKDDLLSSLSFVKNELTRTTASAAAADDDDDNGDGGDIASSIRASSASSAVASSAVAAAMFERHGGFDAYLGNLLITTATATTRTRTNTNTNTTNPQENTDIDTERLILETMLLVLSSPPMPMPMSSSSSPAADVEKNLVLPPLLRQQQRVRMLSSFQESVRNTCTGNSNNNNNNNNNNSSTFVEWWMDRFRRDTHDGYSDEKSERSNATFTQHQQQRQLQQRMLLPLLLRLAYWTCKRNEVNKVRWMKGSIRIPSSSSSSSSSSQQRSSERQEGGGEGGDNTDDDTASSSSSSTALTMPELLVRAIERGTRADCSDLLLLLLSGTCKLMTTLCTYEEELPSVSTTAAATNGDGPTVSSAHANVLQFAELGAVPALLGALSLASSASSSSSSSSPGPTPTTPSASIVDVLNALRSMAIQDTVVQAMIRGGLLPSIRELLLLSERGSAKASNTATATTDEELDADTMDLFEKDVGSDNDGNDNTHEKIAAACLGLVRNVCANDQIKCQLCVGGGGGVGSEGTASSSSIVPTLVSAMSRHLRNATLQEHAVATIAAMALRQPKNAAYMVSEPLRCHLYILKAMRTYPNRASLQRQAALAIRNLGSRSPEIRRELREAGLPEALLQISARHIECQDEVYAALRDIDAMPAGAGMKSVEIVEGSGAGGGGRENIAEMGQRPQRGTVLVSTQSTQMFGEKHNTNFRQVYD